MEYFIPEDKIIELLEKGEEADNQQRRELLLKAKNLKGLSPAEAAILLQSKDKDIIEEIFTTARWVKEAIYGKRLVIFAPLYLSNFCENNCLYCAFKKTNRGLKRKRLSREELKREVEYLEDQGQKRLLLVAGEDPELSQVEQLKELIETIYNTKKGKGSIRRVNVNVAPLFVEKFRILKEAGIGTYQLFQETYHRKTYSNVHPHGAKANYLWRLYALDRAQKAGIDDLGLGVLFGLYDYRFEVLGLLYHSLYLERQYGTGPHTISVPRLTPALNAPLSRNTPYAVNNEDFKKVVAILRLAIPYTGLILSTRETPAFRNQLLSLGISQISAGSRTNPGGYSEEKEETKQSRQFQLADKRSLKEVVQDIIKEGYYPSFCTACYRTGRTGEDFMALAKPGKIKNFCLPNCLLTFKEYLLDYGSEELKQKAENLIGRELRAITNAPIRKNTQKKLKELEKGSRDLYF